MQSAPSTQQAALAPGGAAGVHQAEMSLDNTTMWIVAGVFAAGALCAVLCTNNHGAVSTTVSTSIH